jgi:phage-related protein
MEFLRKIYYYKHYYLDFFNGLPLGAREKFNWTLALIASIERVPSKFFKHIESSDGLYEIRVEFEGNIYRVFSFFDKGNLVILINGFQKKTNKAPKKEIMIAKRLKKEYFEDK